MGYGKVFVLVTLVSIVTAITSREEALFRAPICPEGGYILPRSGCLIWCRRREVYAGFRIRVIDFSIGNRTDGTPCIGVRPHDSASDQSDESGLSSESSISTSAEYATTRGEPNHRSTSNESTSPTTNLNVSEGSYSESKTASTGSDESYEYVVDPLYLGECFQGICQPVFK